MKKLLTAILTIILLFPSLTADCSTSILDESISLASNKLIMDTVEIKKWNEQNENIYINTPISKFTIEFKIKSLSIIPSAKRYLKDSYGFFHEADMEYFKQLNENINYQAITDKENIVYGFIIKRTPLKTFPSHDEVFSSPSSVHDRFLESTLYPFEPVAIIHESRDGEWLFVKMYNYEGWVHKSNVAVTSLEILKLYEKNNNFIVITNPKTYMAYTSTELDMGCVFPLVKQHEKYFTVLCPKQNSDGKLYFSFGYVASEDANIGYLQYNMKNILIQAAKFIDEPYGWGGMNGYRDCSALVMDIFRSVGVKLKRNTDQQETMNPITRDVRNLSKQEKENILRAQPPGSLIFMDGHVMLYLGWIEEKGYILHDITIYYSEGVYVSANKVAITDIYIKNSVGYEYINLFTSFLFISK
ncbi:MAG TPA: NlpC/P60 family protein [Clostridia bacterium]|jgi:hypothetical protein|nr:MAG: Dipeptidyl-peptidase 6 [Firmicutes bacterium ADurb.Bin146]HOD93840.1 NlpC/P60 family protein [Clostridia bacterium]HQM39722.1 NlpC/P60 family protein [Clostridia bacterium]